MRIVQFEEGGSVRMGVETKDGGDIVDVTKADASIPSTTLELLKLGWSAGEAEDLWSSPPFRSRFSSSIHCLLLATCAGEAGLSAVQKAVDSGKAPVIPRANIKLKASGPRTNTSLAAEPTLVPQSVFALIPPPFIQTPAGPNLRLRKDHLRRHELQDALRRAGASGPELCEKQRQ